MVIVSKILICNCMKIKVLTFLYTWYSFIENCCKLNLQSIYALPGVNDKTKPLTLHL